MIAAVAAVVVVVAIVVALFWARTDCFLGKYSKKSCFVFNGGGFVGAMAKEPWGVECAIPEGGGWVHNRCGYA